MSAATNLIRRATKAANRRQLRMIRGKFEKVMVGACSLTLVDSALREFDRVMKNRFPDGLPY